MTRSRLVAPRLLVASAAAVVVGAAALGGLAAIGTGRPPGADPSFDATQAPPAAWDSPGPTTLAQLLSPTPASVATTTPAPVATPSASPQASPSASPQSSRSPVPLVPIVGYWSTERSVSLRQVSALFHPGSPSMVDGPAPATRIVAMSAADVEPLAALLGVEPRGILEVPAAKVRDSVKASANVVGIVRAEDVTADVRALAVNGYQLFGAGRVHDALTWPLLVDEPGVASTFLASPVWTMAAGGDVMLDKAVYSQSIRMGQGVDYAWQGGQAEIAGRYCCGWGRKPLVLGRRTGDAGAVEELFRSADLSIVNLESPEPDRYRYHSSGFVFTGDPALLAGLQDAGIDLAGLANNHIGNAGTKGVLDTIRHLDQLGIAHAGAGTSQAGARQAAWLSAGDGLRIAVLAYCEVEPFSYWAGPGHPGSAAYSIQAILRDIRAARRAGANLVIVMPHWGIEYTDSVLSQQRNDARRMMAAGADLILGSHTHWVGPFEQAAPGRFVFYSLGNLVFDWTHDERTQEGVVVDLTYVGTRLVQIDLHPTVIIAGQPNLLDPSGGTGTVLDAVRRTSEPLLRW